MKRHTNYTGKPDRTAYWVAATAWILLALVLLGAG